MFRLKVLIPIRLSHSLGDISGQEDIGGLIGLSAGDVQYSFAHGAVMGQEDVGGLIGHMDYGEVSYSFATGSVRGCVDIGGLVGDSDHGLINNSYAMGTVIGSVDGDICPSEWFSDSIGGLVGDNKNATIHNSFATGAVSGDEWVGGLVGIGNSGIITNSYYDRDTSGQPDGSNVYNNGLGRTSDEMKNRINYVDWDFGSEWEIDQYHNGGYPYLKQSAGFVTYVDNLPTSGNLLSFSQSYALQAVAVVQRKPDNWVQAGYVFDGWNDAADGSGQPYQEEDLVLVKDNIMLYAQWVKEWEMPMPAPLFSFPDKHVFLNAPASVTVSVYEAVYWIDSGESLEASNASGLIEITADTTAFTDFSVDYDAQNHAFMVVFNHVLADGNYEVQVAGNRVRNHNYDVLPAASASFSVDQTLPGIPVLLTPVEAQWTNDNRPLIRGTAEQGTSLVIVMDHQEAVTVTVDPDGYWQWRPNYDLQEGLHTVSAHGIDSLGRAGESSIPVRFSVDTLPPLIELLGVSALILEKGQEFVDPGAIATDAQAHVEVEVIGTVDTRSPGIYVLDYHAQDLAGNLAEVVTRIVEVREKEQSWFWQPVTTNPDRHLAPEQETVEPRVCAFQDIKDHWAQLLICEAMAKGIVSGTSKVIFNPNGLITRVEFAALLLRTKGIAMEAHTCDSTFIDHERIPEWACATVNTAVQHGLIGGYPDGTLKPLHAVSRAEMAVMLAKIMGWEITELEATSFSDDETIPVWAKGYVQAAAQRGLLLGRGNDRFMPAHAATRAEATVLMLRLSAYIEENQ